MNIADVTLGQWAGIYACTVLCFLAIDAVWLGVVMKDLYFNTLKDVLRPKPDLVPAAVFYLFFVAGLIFFAVVPALEDGSWTTAAFRGALIGLIAYGTYDMTNLSTLKGYPLWLAALDMCWGGVISAVSASAGYFSGRWLIGAG